MRKSRPLARSSRPTSCMANPMLRRISIWFWSTSFPATTTFPEVLRSRVAMIFIVVLLPAPLGLCRPKNSPLAAAKSIPFTAFTSPGYTLMSCSTWTVESPGLFASSLLIPSSPASHGYWEAPRNCTGYRASDPGAHAPLHERPAPPVPAQPLSSRTPRAA